MVPLSELSRLIRDLVSIESRNPRDSAGGAAESRLARFVASWLGARGVDAALEAVAPGRFNVVGRVRGTGGGRSLLLHAHMDTAAAPSAVSEARATIRGDRLYGRGACDMK